MTSPEPHVIDQLKAFGVSRESLDRLDTYVRTLLAWQEKTNLIGPSTVESIWTRHILDSAQLLPLIPAGTRALAELGSGAGIPGVILGIAADFDLHLYESNTKKCAFLREVARITGTRAEIHNLRLEKLNQSSNLPTVGCVVARALAPLPLLLDYAAPFLARGAIGLFHKGQDVDIELTQATKYWKMNVARHQSVVESKSVILEVKEAIHV